MAILAAVLLLTVAACARQTPPEPRLLDSRELAAVTRAVPVGVALAERDGPLLVQITGRDVNHHSRVIDGEGRVVSEIALDFLRSAPVWHLVTDAGIGGPYRLEIVPRETTLEARVHIEQLALPIETRAGRTQMEAWRQLALGLQHVSGEAAADWAAQLEGLDAAERTFDRLGLDDPALWASYFKAYFEYYPLYRYSEALAAAEALAERADERGLSTLQLLTHQLIGQIRIEREADADEHEARTNYRLAQQEFADALDLARAAGNGFETIWALNNSGITFHYQDQPEQALQRYGEALELALILEDGYLVDLIGTNMAVAHEKLGRIEESVTTLQRMLVSLDPASEPKETEHVLNLLGQYYLKLYRFPDALEVLDRASLLSLRLGRTESLGRNRLLLAQAYRELGQPDKSQLNLELAIPDLEASRNGRGLRRAWDLSADLNRLQGRFEAMRADRARQEQYLATDADRAEWLAGRARDAEAGGAFAEAVALNRQAADLFASTPFRAEGQLAALRACVLAAESRLEPGCSAAAMEPAFAALTDVQASVPGLQARYLWGRMMAAEGRPDRATAALRELIAEMQYLRQDLPGVLGAWYWDARRGIFDFYMQLELSAERPVDRVAANSLAALLWLRSAEGRVPSDEPALESTYVPSRVSTGALNATTATTDPVTFAREARELLARRQSAETAAEAERAQRLIDQHLLTHRPAGMAAREPFDPARIERQWRSLPEDWSLLTFYVSPQRLHAWTADRTGLRLHDLGDGAGVAEALSRVKENVRVIGYPELEAELSAWGDRLAAPLEGHLREQVVFIGSGVFSDFPIEALIVDGDYLLRRHTVLNLAAGFDVAGAVGRLSGPLRPERVFLAGNPTGLDPGQPQLAGSAVELETVRQAFPGAMATLLQGRELTLEAFLDAPLSGADLVHIASHAVIDLAYPEFSSIRLSGQGSHGAERLTPADLAGRRLDARLVVLSACSTVGLNRFEFDTHLGFVSAFLEGGAGQVLASLWPIPDRATVAMMEDFYRRAAGAPNLAAALRATKLAAIEAGVMQPGRWAAFQVFGR